MKICKNKMMIVTPFLHKCFPKSQEYTPIYFKDFLLKINSFFINITDKFTSTIWLVKQPLFSVKFISIMQLHASSVLAWRTGTLLQITIKNCLWKWTAFIYYFFFFIGLMISLSSTWGFYQWSLELDSVSLTINLCFHTLCKYHY